MGAPAKFLFDIDFAASGKGEAAVPPAEHAAKVAEAEAIAHRKGYEEAEAEAARRIAEALERVAKAGDLPGVRRMHTLFSQEVKRVAEQAGLVG